jgi:hypothetical protein
MSLFFSQTSKSVCGLSSTTMLFGQFYSDFLKDISDVTLESGKECTTSIYNDKTEFLIIFK